MNSIIHQSLYTPNELMNQVVTNYLTVKGKQIRPIMVILSAALFGNVNEHVLHAGAALEMLHNASLIHDDVVDETSLRRGRQTINSIWEIISPCLSAIISYQMPYRQAYAPVILRLSPLSPTSAKSCRLGKSTRYAMPATITSTSRATYP